MRREFSTDAAFAVELDRADPLARFREDFAIRDPDLIYLDGNSLGRMPLKAAARVHEVVEREWGDRLIRGWGEGWLHAPERLGGKIARLIGAREDEVVVCDSTTVNLFKLVWAALRARPSRTGILSDEFNFPSDLYALQGAAEGLGQGHRLTLARSPDSIHMPAEAITGQFYEGTALLALTHVAFKSGYMHDMASLTHVAHAAGALALWDLSHSAGAVPVDLNGSNVDLAVGCTYKYLNGGPGAPAFLYVRRDLQEQLLNPIRGWFGRENQFEFALDYTPRPDLRRFLVGTPPMLSTAALEAGVDLILEAGMERLRDKSVLQTEYLIYLIDERLSPLGFCLGSPGDPGRRGSHVSIRHPEALRIGQAMIHDARVIPDFRPPDNLRLGVAPLYTTYGEIQEAVDRIERIVRGRIYEKHSHELPEVP